MGPDNHNKIDVDAKTYDAGNCQEESNQEETNNDVNEVKDEENIGEDQPCFDKSRILVCSSVYKERIEDHMEDSQQHKKSIESDHQVKTIIPSW